MFLNLLLFKIFQIFQKPNNPILRSEYLLVKKEIGQSLGENTLTVFLSLYASSTSRAIRDDRKLPFTRHRSVKIIKSILITLHHRAPVLKCKVIVYFYLRLKVLG